MFAINAEDKISVRACALNLENVALVFTSFVVFVVVVAAVVARGIP
jgi:hypothetical protein